MMPSAITDTISRYHLDDVEIGVNIAEEQGWASSLKLTCQIRSFAQSGSQSRWCETPRPCLMENHVQFPLRLQ